MSAASPLPRWEQAGLLLAIVLTAAVRLAYASAPLTSDEAGFLLLGHHWSPGTSLYGDYWVDRPPLLIQLFSLAGELGPVGHTAAGVIAPGVKALGALAAGSSVLLAGLLGKAVGTPFARRVAVLAAVGLLTSPLLGAPEVDGEVLATPFVLLGVLLLVHGVRRPADRSLLLLAGAGAAGVAAALVKQNVIDVAVLALVLLVTVRGRVTHLPARAGAVTAGAVGMLGAVLAMAALHGTSPAGLWEAVVVFRAHAASVISASASPATGDRALHLLGAFVGSGLAPLLLLVATTVLLGLRRGRPAAGAPLALLGWPALAMAGWELVAVIAGGSYWLHYLTGLLPGAVLLLALSRPGRRGRRALAAIVAGVITAAALGHVGLAVDHHRPGPEAHVMTWLRARTGPSDGVVVAFGHPEIVLGSGTSSPYPYLWSLPVRVRDPQLSGLGHVLAGPHPPRWVVVSGASLDSWGLDPTRTQRYLEGHYVEQVAYGDWHVWRRAGTEQR